MGTIPCRSRWRRSSPALRQLIARIDAPQVHLLGHSLGGLIVLRFLQRHSMSQPGRVVFLGTPCAGSRVARRFARWKMGRKMLGPMAMRGTVATGFRALGSAAGSWASSPARARWVSAICC